MAANARPQGGGGNLVQWWTDLPQQLKLTWLMAAAVVGAVVVFVAARLNQPEYVLMYSRLDSSDVSDIAGVLQQQNIPFKLSEGGDALLVPTAARDEARLAVASEGVLPSGPRGYEILDNPSPFALSDFTQKVNLQRAREGELARTLMSLEGVERAHVLFSIPEDSPFLREQGTPGASVALKLRGGRSLSEGDARTIANLVAAAVPNLDPKNVVIIDQQARLLSGPQPSNLMLDPEGKSLVQVFEAHMEGKVRRLLESSYGTGNVQVTVTAQLDLDVVNTTNETVDPDNRGGVVISEQSTEQSTENQPLVDQGIAGTASNVPTYPTPTTESGPSNGRFSESIRNYEVSKQVESVEKAPGAVQRLAVAVVIDQEALEPQERSDLEALIKGAVNFDAARGDQIALVPRVFSTEQEETIAADLKASQRDAQMTQAITIAGWLIVLGLFAWGTLALVKFLSAQAVGGGGGGTGARYATAGGGYLGGGGGHRGLNFDVEIPPMELDPEELAKQKMRQEIIEISKSHPDQAAKVVRSWLREP